MFSRLALVIFAILLSGAVFAQDSQSGTSDEAKAMLEKAVEAMKADETEALEMFNKGEGGFKDRDLYVFCFDASTGIETAHPTHSGEKITDLKDVNGYAFGQKMKKTATEGTTSEITYKWPKPGTEEPVEKTTYYTKVDGQICGVGYYR
jgi:signal transduction histidine kinase